LCIPQKVETFLRLLREFLDRPSTDRGIIWNSYQEFIKLDEFVAKSGPCGSGALSLTSRHPPRPFVTAWPIYPMFTKMHPHEKVLQLDLPKIS
jgi:hypothetical protein